MANVQNYILAQRAENAVKRNRVLSLFERLEEVFLRNISENREIEEIPADKLNILICRLTMDIKKKHGGAYGSTTLASFASCLHSQGKKIIINSIYLFFVR